MMILRRDLEMREEQALAPYAERSGASRGRRFQEPADPDRTAFMRDRDRIVHSSAYRRLGNKTQVFITTEGEYYRTRLTHTEEATQIALTVARSLALNLELTEAISRVHDLGHPPFGHAGEAALARCMAEDGGFEHNEQALRVVDLLEREYPEFPGLNLSWEVREGIAKHGRGIAAAMDELGALPQPSIEAQVADLADSIAYGCHDLDDGLAAELLEWKAIERRAPLWWSFIQPAIGPAMQGLPVDLARRMLKRHLINLFASDLIDTTAAALAEAQPRDADAVRGYAEPLARLSEPIQAVRESLHEYLTSHLYRQYHVETMWEKAQRLIWELFTAFDAAPGQLPTAIRERIGHDGPQRRIICDYIAEMTDRKAVQEHRRLFHFDIHVLP